MPRFIIRHDMQGNLHDRVYSSRGELRRHIVSHHSTEYPYAELKSMSLTELCREFGWEWEYISQDEALRIEKGV